MDTKEIIILARKHVDDNPEAKSSARLALSDAVMLYDNADYFWARNRAVTSLMYSVGVFSPIYQKTLQ